MPIYIKRKCDRHGVTKFKLENRGAYRCVACAVERVAKCRRRNKQRLLEEFGGACELCGYKRCSRNLHFHHYCPKTKSFGIGQGDTTRAYKTLLEEAKKCILVCSNCHGEVEEGVREVPQMILERFVSSSMVEQAARARQPANVNRPVAGSSPA